MVSPLFHCGHLLSGAYRDKCLCCDETVGEDDAQTIAIQLNNREKNCMWCGDDFNLSDEEVEYIVDDNSDIDEFATILNDASNACRAAIKDGQMFLDVETDEGWHKGVLWEKKTTVEKRRFEEERKKAIKSYYGIDIDKEKFDPGYADKDGNPHDRVLDAVPYEEIPAKGLVHRLLKFIKKYPNCTAADIKRGVKFTRKVYYGKLQNQPTSRLYASGLITCDSTFTGFVDMSSMASKFPSGYFGKIPRFSRKYAITLNGEGVLGEFESGRKKVLL